MRRHWHAIDPRSSRMPALIARATPPISLARSCATSLRARRVRKRDRTALICRSTRASAPRAPLRRPAAQLPTASAAALLALSSRAINTSWIDSSAPSGQRAIGTVVVVVVLELVLAVVVVLDDDDGGVLVVLLVVARVDVVLDGSVVDVVLLASVVVGCLVVELVVLLVVVLGRVDDVVVVGRVVDVVLDVVVLGVMVVVVGTGALRMTIRPP